MVKFEGVVAFEEDSKNTSWATLIAAVVGVESLPGKKKNMTWNLYIPCRISRNLAPECSSFVYNSVV